MPIEEVKPKPNQELIKVLKEVLELAESGEVQSAAVALAFYNGSTGNCFDGDYNTTALLGAIRILERDAVDICIPTQRKVAWEFTE